MLKAKDKITIIFAIIGTIILISALTCTVVLAAFTANKTATTTIKFHSGITLTITEGVSSERWQYAVDGSPTYGTTGTPLKQLTMQNIKVKATQGSPCYIRVFCFFTINSSNSSNSSTLPSATPLNDLTPSSISSNENDFINDYKFTDGQYTAYAGTRQLTNSTAVTVINAYELFKITNNTQDITYNGKQVRAYFRIYASTDNFTSGNESSWNNTFFNFTF